MSVETEKGHILASILKEHHALKELLKELANSAVSFDDERIGYVDVQINRETWEKLQKDYRNG